MILGQDLEDIINRLPIDGLKSMVGGDIWMSLKAINCNETDIRKVAAYIVREHPEDIFSKNEVRAIFHDSLSSLKLQELLHRLGLHDRKALDTFSPDNRRDWKRYIGFFGIEFYEDTYFTPVSSLEIIPTEFGLFPHQRKVADRVWRKLDGGHTRTILHMPTGAGKTRTAMSIISRFLNAYEPAVIVWLAASSELLEQAADAFQIAWKNTGNRKLPMIRMWGNYNANLSDISDGLIIAGFQKLHALSDKDPITIRQLALRTKLVVVDEAHQAIAPTYASLIDTLSDIGSSHSVLGLTATPGRTWSDIEKDEKLSIFFDNNKITLEINGWDNPVDYLIAEGYLARPKFNKLEYETSNNFVMKHLNKDNWVDEFQILEQLTVDTERNKAIIAEIERLITMKHTRIILFAASIRHAHFISSFLIAKAIDSGVITGTTEQNKRQRIIKRFRSPSTKPMVICNFGVLTTGFDAPNTSAAIIARPTKSLVLYSQMVGRAMRGVKAGGNKTCEITTIVDTSLPGFGNMSEAFINWEDVWNESTELK